MEQNQSQPQVGMSMRNPSLLKESEFSLAVNANLQSVSGNFALINNDQSNILATKFKEGFKVIGTNLVPALSCTFFFLVNPSTQESEIGFILDGNNQDSPDPVINCSTCNQPILEDTPLEQTVQSPLSLYYTFVNAKCLNFSIDNPVTSWIKVDDCNVRIYFNDFKNPPRYINYKDFQKIDISNCPLIETDQLDCDKILIFPETCYPTIEVADIVSGGQNTAGVYQFAVCYSDVRSNKITDYFYVSNPTPLYSQPIIPNNNTAYPIAKSFKLEIGNLNTDFKYFNIAVLKTINNVTSVFLIETFEIKSSSFSYVYTGIDKNLQADLSIDEIIGRRPHYNKGKITTENNGYLFIANLEEDRVINLQPVISNIPLFWQTVKMDEGSYSNPIIAQNTVGYLGDEVYAFGIAFTKQNGTKTPVFPFVGRNATSYDLDIINNTDVIGYSSCDSSTPPNKRWQVYNTGSIIGSAVCISTSSSQTPVNITDSLECFSDQILMNSVVSYNQSTGVYVYTTTPLFYYYPSTNPSSAHFIGLSSAGVPYNYPPRNTADIDALNTYKANPVNQIPGNPAGLASASGIWNCPNYLSQYPAGSTENILPINQDPQSVSSSVEIIQDETFVYDNVYKNPSTGQITPKTPTPAGTYPLTPNPTNGDLTDFQNWYNTVRTNTTAATATSLFQSTNATCPLDNWGAFTYDPLDPLYPPQDSWYSFLCSNTSGVAAIQISLGPNYPSNFSFEVYDNVNSITPLTPVAGSTSTYKFYENLSNNSQYYIRVIAAVDIGAPPDYLKKNAPFKVCILSPTPISSKQTTIPATVRLIQTHQITYQGIPENNCKPRPDKYGNFAYWESTETYPCNEQVWENLAGTPIRHFKFPDFTSTDPVPFFEQVGSIPNNLSVKTNKIFPKGIIVDVNHIKLALDDAVIKGLITEDERNSICGYRIYRSNRRGNQSIVAKGLLYDVWEYKDNIYNTGNRILFPNFPFNDNNANPFISTKKVTNSNIGNDSNLNLLHPYSSLDYVNNKYTIDAPNLSFNNPGLGTEIKLECEQTGKAIGNYSDVKNNSVYQYVGAGIISAAIGFASVEAAFEALNTMANATLTIPIEVFGSGTSLPLGLILALVGENILAPMRIYSHYSEWYDIIKKYAPFRNYAIFYNGVGKYLNYALNSTGNIRRTVANSQYLKPGILNVNTTKGSIRFNNFKRDSSVFIELAINSTFLKTSSEDTSRQLPICNNSGVTGDISSYYGSLKNVLVNQYGQIDNIQWIDTGYDGYINWSDANQDTRCDTIFGGDTYITRFTKKRKTPMFLDDRVIPSSATNVGATNQDIQMSLLPNIGYPKYFMDYPNTLDYNGISQALFGDVAVYSTSRADYNFLCFSSSGQSWQDAGLGAAIIGGVSGVAFGVISIPIALAASIPTLKSDLGDSLFLNGKYVHSFYGITSFLCESDYNLDLRHGENLKEKNFYPNVGDITEWTQECFVPMSEDNSYLYNNDYSKQNTLNPNFVINNDYDQVKQLCKSQHPNRLIYSLQDNDQNDLSDGNLVFLANNYYEFPKSGGKLLIVKGIENGKVLAIQENRAAVFNSYIALQTNVATATVGSNTLFASGIPSQFLQTDLGYGGSQTPAIVSTEFGHFWVDNKRGQILQFQQGIQNIVKPEEEWWFKENLPFKILKDFPDFDITNNYKYVGMTIAYDARYKRMIFTKRDVELKPAFRNFIKFDGTSFYNISEPNKKFTLENPEYFCNKSWTISYNPLFKSFISFHSFTPNYYISNQSYFSSGINYSFEDISEEGLWHHNLTSKSYQVYYGKLKPFIFEFTVNSKMYNRVLENVEYIAEFYRYQDNMSSALITNKTYNKALIYNQNQTTGVLNLVPKEKNNRRQFLLYPKQNQDSRDILTEKIENIWRFNNFYSVAKNDGQPLMTYDCNNIAYKEPNPLAINYKVSYIKDIMRSDYHVLRLINDKWSNYQILHRFAITDTINSPS